MSPNTVQGVYMLLSLGIKLVSRAVDTIKAMSDEGAAVPNIAAIERLGEEIRKLPPLPTDDCDDC